MAEPRTFPTQPSRIANRVVADGSVSTGSTYRKFGDQPARIKNK